MDLVDMSAMDPAVLAEYHRHITERLGIDTAADPDPLIDMPQIATLAGLSLATPMQRRQRTRKAIEAGRPQKCPFPDPAPGVGDRWPDKPVWRAVTQICPYLEKTGSWPPGSAARVHTRGPREESEQAA